MHVIVHYNYLGRYSMAMYITRLEAADDQFPETVVSDPRPPASARGVGLFIQWKLFGPL
jgi:hypothetical protein